MQVDRQFIDTVEACKAHARALLQSAKAVFAAGHSNIAYHLALLSLEELGRRELIGVQSIAEKREGGDTGFIERQLQNHVDKLFWCFFAGTFGREKLTKEHLESTKQLARVLHEKRLAALYVDRSKTDLNIPSEAVTREESDNLIKLAEARLGMAEAEVPREQIPNAEVELQTWFLKNIEKPEIKRFMFSRTAMDKLHELQDVKSWTLWIKEEIERDAKENLELTRQELQRGTTGHSGTGAQKWKIRVRILTASHSIRPKAVNYWNQRVSWIKLITISGKKDQLYVDILLPDTIDIHRLWFIAWGAARHFVVALNIGTMGFWWWRLPVDVDAFYEAIEDVQHKRGVKLTRSPSLKIDWGENRILAEEDMDRVIAAMAALPTGPGNPEEKPFGFYIGGLTFLALNDVHWQCESNIFGNFYESLKWMMERCGDWKIGEPFAPAHAEFLRSFSQMDATETERFSQLARAFESGLGDKVQVTLKEASFEKLFCDAYFQKKLMPVLIKARREERETTTDKKD